MASPSTSDSRSTSASSHHHQYEALPTSSFTSNQFISSSSDQPIRISVPMPALASNPPNTNTNTDPNTFSSGLFTFPPQSYRICAWAICCPPFRWARTMANMTILPYRWALLLYGVPWIVLRLFAIAQSENGDKQQQQHHQISSYAMILIITQLMMSVGLIAMAVLGRYRMRTKLHIRGDVFQDCLAHACCSPCALTQEAIESEGWRARMDIQGGEQEQE